MEHILEHTGRFSAVDFNETSLTLVKGKYYVVATVPAELREKLGKQIRRSTGTSDRSVALRRKHDITEEIYSVFRQNLRGHKLPITEQFFAEQGFKDTDLSKENFWELLQAIEYAQITNQVRGFDTDTRAQAELQAAIRADPEYTEQVDSNLSAVATRYFAERSFERVKTKTSAQSHVAEFIELVGDKEIGVVSKLDGYNYCKHLDKQGAAAKTINSKLSSIRSMMTWAEQQGIIQSTPLVGMSLKAYGKKAESYRPIPVAITRSILNDTEAAKQEIQLLAAMFFTGCRIDEWAAANYEQIKLAPEGFRYLDLSDAVVKNDGSERFVPLHPALDKIIGEGKGRIFSYPLDADGKATNAASKATMKVIRRHTNDKLHTAHSYRHGFKDLLRDVGVSKEVNDFITGHDQGDVAGKYGAGVSLRVRYEAICMIDAAAVL